MQISNFPLNKRDCFWFQISQNWRFFASGKKTNFCSSLEHKFYARNPQKASAFLRGKTLLKNMSKTPESKMRITRFSIIIFFLLKWKSCRFSKKRKKDFRKFFRHFQISVFFSKIFFFKFFKLLFFWFLFLILYFTKNYILLFHFFNLKKSESSKRNDKLCN